MTIRALPYFLKAGDAALGAPFSEEARLRGMIGTAQLDVPEPTRVWSHDQPSADAIIVREWLRFVAEGRIG